MPDDSRNDLIDILEAVSRAQIRALRRLRRAHRGAAPQEPDDKGARMSHLDMVQDVLRIAGRPLHITAILAEVSKRHGIKLDRESVVSALAKRIARKDRFVRTGPNTFGVIAES